jgi:signal transduction histidine kinase
VQSTASRISDLYKHLIGVSLLLILFVSVGSAAVAAQDPKIVRVGIYENQPKIFTDDKGNASGFWPDIIEYIASEEGWTIEYKRGTWSECLKMLENNEIDIMPDVAYTEERNRTYNFSHEVVYTSWSSVYSREGANINSIPDLAGKNIAVLKGSVNVEGPEGVKQLVKAYNIDCRFNEVDSYTRVFEQVESGQADAGVASKDFGNQHEIDYKIVKTPIIFQPSQLYFAFSKNSSLTPDLIAKIDQHVKGLKADNNSIYYKSLNNWLGVRPAEKSVLPGWIIWTLAGIGGLVLLFAGGSFVLRSQVRSKTKDLTAEIINRRRAEEQLVKYRYHLEKLVEDRTAELGQKNRELETANSELIKAKEAAESADRVKSTFLATMSHELRTPLNSIIGFTGVLQQELVGPLNAEQKKQMGMVRGSSAHLLNLINDVLDISKIEAGQLTVVSEPCDMRAAIEKISGNMRPLAEKKSLSLKVVVAPEVGTITSDQRRVEQVIYNLVNNAIKFTEKGSVLVECHIKDGEAITRVIDTGIGIKSQDTDQLFKPFHQIDTGIVRQYEGTGLGLSICKKILDLLGGRIWVESELGKGSTFSFALPFERRS